MKKQILTAFTVLFLLVSFFPKKLLAQDVVAEQILTVSYVMALDGYKPTHDVKYASLYNGRRENYYFTLNSGWYYQIVAVCDSDCGDIDMCLYNENGGEIDCDTTTDDKPIVTARPKWTGRFRLNVNMYDCNINPCKFGIAVYGK